jgi:hypothetical protein
MAIFEYVCPKCGSKIERVVIGKIEKPAPVCRCGQVMEQVEWPLPASRSARYGIQT